MRLDRSTNSGGSDPVSGLRRAKAGIHKIENRMRRQVSSVAKRISTSFHHEEGEELPSRKVREGIVSINGRDVETMRCTGSKRC
jgi:hypothetical protein